MESKPPITIFDLLSTNQSLQMFKAIIPFFDFNTQKALALFIRFNELQQTLSFYSSQKSYHSIRSCVKSPVIQLNDSLDSILGNDELIHAILPYCPEKYRIFLQNIKQFSKMSDLFNIFNGENFSTDMSDFSNLFNSMNFSNKAQSSSDSKSTHESHTSVNNEDSILNSFLNPEQQKMYNDFLNKLDNVDFTDLSDNKNVHTNNHDVTNTTTNDNININVSNNITPNISYDNNDSS